MRRWLIALALGGLCACASSKSGKGPEGDKQAREADELMDDAEKAMRTFDTDSAYKDLKKVREILKDPALQTHPDLSVLWDRFNQAQGDLEIAQKEKAKHELEEKVKKQETNLEAARGPLLKALDEADKPDLTKDRVDAVKSTSKDFQEALDKGRVLESQDPGYAAEAKHTKGLIEKAQAALALSDKRLTFIQGPLATAAEGLKLATDAKTEKDRDKRQQILTDAKARLQKCIDGTAQTPPEIVKVTFLLDGKPKPPDAVGTACKTSMKTADKQLAVLAKAPKRRGKK